MARTEELSGIEGEGVAPKKIKALDAAIDDWRKVVNKRMSLTKDEVSLRQSVLDLMHKHNLRAYPYVDDGDEEKILVVEANEKVKLVKPENTGSEAEPENE